MKYEQILDYLVANPTKTLRLNTASPAAKAKAALYSGMKRALAARASTIDTDLLSSTHDLNLNTETELSFKITATSTSTGTELAIKLVSAPARLIFTVLGVTEEFGADDLST